MTDFGPSGRLSGEFDEAVELIAAAEAPVLLAHVHPDGDALGWPLDRNAALNLYVGLLTDTGRFQYPNTTPNVFMLAEELSKYGLPLADVTRELFEKHRFAYVQLAGLALARAQLDPDRHLVAAWITADELARHGVDVGAIATALGGGGHAFMAGFTSQLSVDDTLARIRALVPEHAL